jgi:hypothetical protein
MPIEFINKSEVLASLQKKKEKLAAMPRVASQMGFLALNEIRSNCAVKTGNWRDSWNLEVNQQGEATWELKVFSPGAFAENGFDYGELQERTRWPGAIGWHRAIPLMIDLFRTAMSGEESNLVMAPSEFSSMSGMI